MPRQAEHTERASLSTAKMDFLIICGDFGSRSYDPVHARKSPARRFTASPGRPLWVSESLRAPISPRIHRSRMVEGHEEGAGEALGEHREGISETPEKRVRAPRKASCRRCCTATIGRLEALRKWPLTCNLHGELFDNPHGGVSGEMCVVMCLRMYGLL